MSQNILEFKPKNRKVEFEEQMFTMSMYIDQDGQYSVEMDLNDNLEDHMIFEAMLAAAFKFAADHGIEGEEPEMELVEDE